MVGEVGAGVRGRTHGGGDEGLDPAAAASGAVDGDVDGDVDGEVDGEVDGSGNGGVAQGDEHPATRAQPSATAATRRTPDIPPR